MCKCLPKPNISQVLWPSQRSVSLQNRAVEMQQARASGETVSTTSVSPSPVVPGLPPSRDRDGEKEAALSPGTSRGCSVRAGMWGPARLWGAQGQVRGLDRSEVKFRLVTVNFHFFKTFTMNICWKIHSAAGQKALVASRPAKGACSGVCKQRLRTQANDGFLQLPASPHLSQFAMAALQSARNLSRFWVAGLVPPRALRQAVLLVCSSLQHPLAPTRCVTLLSAFIAHTTFSLRACACVSSRTSPAGFVVLMIKPMASHRLGLIPHH
jgi:hypothetical protein